MISLTYANRVMTFPMIILCAFANAAFAADMSAASLQQATVPQTSRKLGADQLEEANARVNLANTIINRVSPDAESKGLEPSWRINLLGLLYNLSSAQLRNIEPNTTTVDQAYSLANSVKKAARASGVVAKSLGSSTDSLVFTPLTPCRFIDTRVTGGVITTTRDFNLLDTGSTYGGSASCSVPGVGEPAVAANVTVVVAAGSAGYIGIRSYGSSNTTSFLNWSSAGAPSGLANAGIITAAKDSGGDYEFEVFNGSSSSSPQVILDFFGYFSASAQTSLSCVSTGLNGNSVGAGHSSVVSSACPSGYSVVSAICGGQANVVLNSTILNQYANNTVTCYYDNNSGQTVSISAAAYCCQVP